MKNPLIQPGRRFVPSSRLLPLCLLLFAVSLLTGFLLGFPGEILRERLVQEFSQRSGLVVRSDELGLAFPAKLELDLSVESQLEQLLPLEFKPLLVEPVWSSLISEPRSIALNGRIAEGEIDAQLSSDERLQLTIRGLRLGPLQKPDNSLRFGGVLNGQLEGEQISQPARVDAVFSVAIGELMAFGLDQFSLPKRLMLGQLELQGRLRGQRLNLEQVNLDGGFATLRGNGTVQLGPTARQTRLNLRAVLTPGERFPEALQTLIELGGIKARADGSFQFRISGTLALPVLR